MHRSAGVQKKKNPKSQDFALVSKMSSSIATVTRSTFHLFLRSDTFFSSHLEGSGDLRKDLCFCWNCNAECRMLTSQSLAS